VGGADYTALSGLATIPAGQSSVQISIDVLNDNVVELPETVSVTLTGVNHPSVAIDTAGNQATVTINDDDPTTVSIAANDPSGSEPGADDGQFTVTLGGGTVAPAGGIVVSYTASGTATGGADYTALAGTVTIPAGQSSATILVDVLDDNVVELPETAILTLTGTNHAAVTVQATANTASVTINDGVGENTVSIAATDATGNEPGVDDGLFTVALAGGKLAPGGGIAVTYTISGTATAGSDYTALFGTVTIPAGQSSATIPVDILNDNIVELPETVIVTLTGTNHSGVTIAPANNAATVTINDGTGADSDATTVSITATDATGSEPGTDDGLFTVTLAGGKIAPTGGVTVSYTVSGSATAGTDSTALTGTVTIPAGASSATIPVDVLNDNIVELAETVIVMLTSTNHAGVTVASTNNGATVTIADGSGADSDATTVSITASDATGTEPGTDDGAFTVTLDGGKLAPTGGIAVTYTITGTATGGADYATLTGTVTIPAGQASVAIPVDVLDDNFVEVPETVIATLTGTDHAGATIHATNKTATVTIDSATDAATVSLTATDATGREPGLDDAQFTVTLSGGKLAPAGGIVVTYTTSGPASSGSDFTALAGTVTILAGSSSATIAVDVLDDNVVESSETVILALTGTNHTGATIASTNNAATATIEDDDATTVSISVSDADAGEPDNDGQFSVTLDNGKVAPTGGIVVTYTTGTAAGAATPGSDYTTLTGSVTIPAGATSATIAVDVSADTTADEPAETVSVTLASANHPSVTLSTASRSATVTIAADDLRNASISGVVWIDANNDRQQQKDTAGTPLEPGIPGVIVQLTGTARDGSPLNLQAMTDDDGIYRFTDLPAGTYEVREEQPAAWMDGQEMLTSSTVNDTYSNLVLTPGQQATNHSFGERTLQPQFISKRQFLASTPVTDVYLRELNALAKQRAGDTAGAQAIRDASIPSVVSANSTASARLAQDASLDEASDEASDEAPLAAGESAPVAPVTTPGGEGESTVSPVVVATLPVRETATGRVTSSAKAATEATSASQVVQPTSRAVPTIASGLALTSKVAPVNADPPSAATPVGTRMRDARRAVTSAAAFSLLRSPASEEATRQESAEIPALPPIRRSPRLSRTETHCPASTASQVSDRSPLLRLRETDQDMAQLVDMVFAEDAWLDRPST
jgi:hypothetical protein